MAQIELRLSSKIQKDTGRSEIMIRFYQGSKFDLYGRSDVFVSPSFFEYFINRKATISPKREIPKNAITATKDDAIKYGWSLRNSGDLVIRSRIETPETIYHREQEKRLEALKTAVWDAYQAEDKTQITKEWLQDVINQANHPETFTANDEAEEKKTFYDIVEDYIKKRNLVYSNVRTFHVMSRAIARYEGFIRATDKKRKKFVFDIGTIGKEDIEDLQDYLLNEKALSQEYPKLFERLLSDYPATVKSDRVHKTIEERGENTVLKILARLKSVCFYALEEGLTTNRPFELVKLSTAKFGTPYYITIDERNKIADTDLQAVWDAMSKDEQKELWKKITKSDKKRSIAPIETIKAQRDIFVFQCLIGCRVGDLLTMKEDLITDGVLVYTPHKTKDDGESVQARVPLHPKAVELIRKYRGMDKKGRLFPFISAQKYNDAIKVVFTLCGITRKVEVRNTLTGENETRPINEIASSHLARRTFVGNAYFKVHDPNLIGKMSGHVEGSQAFKRYRKIEDETLKEVIDLIG